MILLFTMQPNSAILVLWIFWLIMEQIFIQRIMMILFHVFLYSTTYCCTTWSFEYCWIFDQWRIRYWIKNTMLFVRVFLHTPLHLASSYGNIYIVQFLINHEANINAKDCDLNFAFKKILLFIMLLQVAILVFWNC